jgi:hypothetical protein
MSVWEKRILEAFTRRYLASAGARAERGEIRLRSASLFPGFDAAVPDEKEAYLEAAEDLEREGLMRLTWEKRKKGQRLLTLACGDFERLFARAGARYPRTEAEEIRRLLADTVLALKALPLPEGEARAGAEKTLSFLDWLSRRFGPREAGRGMDRAAVAGFLALAKAFFEPEKLETISLRALSVTLYRDSKRLENLLELFGPVLSLACRSGAPAPDLSFLERSWPETLVAGKLVFEYKTWSEALVNPGGGILGFPLESAEGLSRVRTLAAKTRPAVLTVENKETFYAVASPRKYARSGELSRYECFLYTGGYPNRAAAALIKTLAASGFCIYHAGDLDPDGILILQNVADIANLPVCPVRMDSASFDRYFSWSRPLSKTMLRQMKKIRKDTLALPALEGLARRITETGRGVEQEIIDYR